MSVQELEFASAAAGTAAVILETALFYMLWDTLYRTARERATQIAGGVLLLVNIALEFAPDISAHMRLLFLCPLILCYAYVRDKTHWKKALFAITLFYGFRSLSWLIANSVQQYVSACVYRSPDYIGPDIEAVYRDTAYLIAVFFLLYLFTLSLLLLGLRRVLIPPGRMSWYDVSFLSVLNIVGGLFANLVVNISMVRLDGGVFLLYDEKREMLWLLPLIALLLYLGELSAIVIFQRYRSLQRERELYLAEQQQLRAMKQRLEEAESFYGSIRRVRHEMKNHLTNLCALVAGEQYDGLERYLEKLDADVGELCSRYATGNAVTDVILSDKSKRAEKAGIRFEAQFSYEEADGIDMFDIGIVLNNLLDNAITACENMEVGERFVTLALRRRKHFLLLEVENSYSGELAFADDGLPQTTKQSRDWTAERLTARAGRERETAGKRSLPEILTEHGIGLRNVKEIAERYFGTLDIRTDNRIFKVSVLLQQAGQTPPRRDFREEG